jgi:hypothetical protein
VSRWPALPLALSICLVAAAAAQARPNPGLAAPALVEHGNAAVAGHGAGRRYWVARQTSPTVASAASTLRINTPVPLFTLQLFFNRVGNALQLTRFQLHNFFRKLEPLPAGGCTGCTGNGRFSRFKIKGHTLTEWVEHGSLFLTAKTKFFEVVTSPGEIGRYKVYGVDVFAGQQVLEASGCTPANLALNNKEALSLHNLWTVPCTAPRPHGDRVSLSVPLELPSTGSAKAMVAGHASGSQWLAVFQSGSLQRGCAPNALAEDLLTHAYFDRKVRGHFKVRYTTARTSTPGYTCAYLQNGPRLKLKGGAVLPYGRVLATAGQPYLAGDTVAITGDTSGTAGATVSETFAGHASVKEELYVFAPATPCASTAQKEFANDTSDFAHSESGTFSAPLTITLSAESPATVYICAYLQFGKPSQGVPTGPTLAVATGQIAVAPAGTPP